MERKRLQPGAIVAVLMLGCAAIPGVVSAGAPVTVRLWNWNVHDKKYQQKMYKLFNERHPDIKIEYSSITNTVYDATLEASFVANDPPDMFLPSGKYDFNFLRTKGLIRPLNEVAPNDKELKDWMALYPPMLRKFVEGLTIFDGKPYIVDLGGESAGIMPLYYNKTLFKEAGIAAPPKIERELRADAAKITQAGAGKYFGITHGLRYSGVWGNDLEISLTRAAGVVGAATIDWGPSPKTGTFMFTSPEFINAISLWINMRKDGSVFPGDTTMDDEQAKMAFATNKAGLIFGGSWVVGNALAYSPDADFDLTLPPGADDGVFRGYWWDSSAGGAFGYVVSKASKNPQAVWEVIKFLCSAEYQSGYVQGGLGISFLPEADKPENFQVPQMYRFIEWLPLKRLSPWTPINDLQPYISGIYPTHTDVETNVYLGASEMMPALQDLQKRIEKAFDDSIQKANAAGLKISRQDFYFPDWDISKDYPGKKK